jgi:hypothetical protein
LEDFVKKFYKIKLIKVKLAAYVMISISTVLSGSLQGNGDVCDKIKHIDPNAPQEEYRSLVKEILESGESICSCMSQKCNKKVEGKLQGLAKEWRITDQQLGNIKEFVKRMAEKDSKEGELFVEIDPQVNLSPEMVPFITKFFKEAGYKNGNVHVKKGTDPGVSGVIRLFLPDVNFNIEKYYLDLGYRLNLDSLDTEKFEIYMGTLLHEVKGHVAHHDAIVKNLLFLSASAHNQDINDDCLRHHELLLSRQKYSRAMERRADQVPAACGTVENAKWVYYFSKDIKERLPKDKPEEKSTHPTAEKRIAWATRILNLKKAEEELKKDMKNL